MKKRIINTKKFSIVMVTLSVTEREGNIFFVN